MPQCSLPVTARGVVTLVATNYGLFSISPAGVTMDVIAPGLTVDEVKSATGCALHVAENLRVAQG